MKPVLTVIGLLIAVTLLASCGDYNSESESGETDTHTSHAADTPDDGLAGLELNDGHKWQMDEHTTSIFAKMIASFPTADLSPLEGEGLKKAGETLNVHIGELIQGCTMTGDAHNQLHVYLSAYIPAVTALSESGRTEDARKVKHLLEKYGEYFE